MPILFGDETGIVSVELIIFIVTLGDRVGVWHVTGTYQVRASHPPDSFHLIVLLFTIAPVAFRSLIVGSRKNRQQKVEVKEFIL